jgi:putative Ca2+/H+ antiporter (TMEM165/GDT1 family)
MVAREEVGGVIVGGVLGHGLCTGLAVLGGRMIAQKISIKAVTIAGGIVFILFALSAFIVDPMDDAVLPDL